jgi:hypothetical protein
MASLLITVYSKAISTKRRRQILAARDYRNRKRQAEEKQKKNKLILEYARYTDIYVKRKSNIGVPVLIYTLKTKNFDEIYNIFFYFVEKYLRPLLYRILEMPLNIERSINIFNNLIDKKNEDQIFIN